MIRTATILIILLAYAVVPAQHGQGSHGSTQPARIVWLDDGLGKVDHPVTTKSAEAQKYFNQGLAYLYAFNHDEGVASFREAAKLDPDMAMAYWGMSLGLGANYNDPANTDRFARAYVELQKAIALAPKVSKAEQDYIAALSKRYSADPKTDPSALAAAYKGAMAELVKTYPDDLDAATLYAESMMNLRPWQLWSLDGKPAEGTLDIVNVLEGVLRRNPNHTGANHYYIHAVEASPSPERATAAADRLIGLAPSAGHLVHMPSHIYLLTGDMKNAVKSNELAIVADKTYIERSGANGIYPLMYFNHNVHMLAAAQAEAGNYAGSIKAANELAKNVGPNVKAMPMLEMFMPYPIIALTRFHKWDEIMKYPKPAPEMLITTAHWQMARGIALAESGKHDDADKELAAMRETMKKIPATAMLFTTPATVALKVGEELLTGEIALARGDRPGAIAAMRMAAASEAKVNYAEPPDWDLPVREWLGRALMIDGKFGEAEKAYREEIDRNRRNGRALFGLAEALARQGKSSSAVLVRKEFEEAWRGSDFPLTADLFSIKKAGKTAAVRSGKIKLSTGITMNYVESGDPRGPAVLLMHGYSDSSFSFSRVLPLLDKKYRILAIDHRGHGDSDKPMDGYQMRDFAADAAAFLDAMNVKSAIVVGHSMGSFVAMQTAIDHPAKVSRLVLVGTAAKARNAVVEEVLGAVSTLPDPVPSNFIREFQVGTSSPSLPKDFIDGVVAESSKVPARVWRKAMEGVAARDFTPDLKRIRVPVTIIWGEKETVFKRDDQDPLIKGLPNAKFVVYPNSGHAPNWEEPEKFANELNEIFSGSYGTSVN